MKGSTISASETNLPPTDNQVITITVDGEPLAVQDGQTIAAGLMAAGWKYWRKSVQGHPRGIYCGIGVCFECLVTVNGEPNVRACQTHVVEGMLVETAYKREDGA